VHEFNDSKARQCFTCELDLKRNSRVECLDEALILMDDTLTVVNIERRSIITCEIKEINALDMAWLPAVPLFYG
jgi:hypothetical protein